MELLAVRAPDYSGYCITFDCVISQSEKIVSINFLVDTGCTVTNLSHKDFLEFNIGFDTLERIKDNVFTTDGQIPMRKINNCKLTFENNVFSITEKLVEIHVQPQTLNNNYDISQLGLNFLRRYTIKFRNDVMVLEK